MKILHVGQMRRSMSVALVSCVALAFSLTVVQATSLLQKRSAQQAKVIAVTSGENLIRKRGAKRKQSDKFSNILLTTQHGRKVRFYDDLIKDKVVMINLMYTTCVNICPPNSLRLAQIHDHMDKWMGRDITVLSLSIDGKKVDTPERLKSYWQEYGAKPGWLFLTGDYDDIDRLRRELGVYDLDPIIDADKSQHSGVLTIGNDRTDRWIALPILMHTRQLAASIFRNMWDEQWQKN